MDTRFNDNLKNIMFFLVCLTLIGLTTNVFAAGGGSADDIGGVAAKITATFDNIGKMITGMSYILGSAFMIAAIMKFKQHKDNPTQIPVGTPIALIFIGASLVFLPSLVSVSGKTLFDKPTTAGPGGTQLTAL